MTVKEQLEQAIVTGDLDKATELLEKYQGAYGDDFDRFSIYANYYLLKEDWETALSYAKNAVALNPHSLEAAYNMAYISEGCKNYADAYKYYNRLLVLQRERKNPLMNEELVAAKLKELEDYAGTLETEEREVLQRAFMLAKIEEINASNDPFYKSGIDLIDYCFLDNAGASSYVGRHHDWYNTYWGKNRTYDIFDNQAEMFSGAKSTDSLTLDIEGDYILPLVPVPGREENTRNELGIENMGQRIFRSFGERQCYRYLRLSGPVNIVGTCPFIAAEPIALTHKSGNKKLVLALFVDSMNWRTFSLASETGNAMEGMKKIMPNTYAFFKEGVICENAFVNSEWTTPSLSSYWTGVHSPKHMAMDTDVWWEFSREQKLLPEYFKEAGYMTARLGNNYSAAPSKGYMRGTDRVLIQSGHVDVSETVSDIINQLSAFEECDQFVWVNFENLHAVAGNFSVDIDVQTHTPVQYYEPDNHTKSTVKQTRSLNKQTIYMNELSHMDIFLGLLFDYITKHYAQEEYIVSLFSDHGTAFMVDDDQPIICKQRMQVPMMFRADKYQGQISELVQSVDYAQMLLSMAGIPYDASQTDAHLPVFSGGEKEREYAIAQTIFQGDPYQAVVMGRGYSCYVKTKAPVDSEFRIDTSDLSVWLVDDDGNILENEEMENRCRRIVLDNISHLIKYQ